MSPNRDTLLAVEHLGGPVYWLSFIRRPYSAELREFAKEMHSRIFYHERGQSSYRLQNPSRLKSLKEVIGKPSDGQLAGGGSEFWIISRGQWDAIVAEDRA